MILCLTTPGNTGYSGGPLEISGDLLPNLINIGSPYPNPFNGNVSIPIDIEKQSMVNFFIYDIGGSLVFSSNQNYVPETKNNFLWNGKSNNGKHVSSGTYIININNKASSETKKVVYIK
jgi:hypothetical protein